MTELLGRHMCELSFL